MRTKHGYHFMFPFILWIKKAPFSWSGRRPFGIELGIRAWATVDYGYSTECEVVAIHLGWKSIYVGLVLSVEKRDY